MRKILEKFLDESRVYVRESGTNIAHDDRESSEFVDVFVRHNPELFPVKRDPLPDGVLPLAEEELVEFRKSFGYHRTKSIVFQKHIVADYLMWVNPDGEKYNIENIRAILWLAQHFNLGGSK